MLSNSVVWKYFKWPLGISLLLLGGTWVIYGLAFAVTVAILAVMEITLSFDNATVNAKILKGMSAFWQKMFLGIGIIIAVGFMRLLFPLLIVMATAGLNMGETWNLALHDPHRYNEYLEAAHPAIAAFGGVFLLMIFLDWWLTKEEREHNWFAGPEKLGTWLKGKMDMMSTVAALGLTVLAAHLSGHSEVLLAGVLGYLTYQLVQFLDQLTEAQADAEAVDESALASGVGIKLATGAAGFVLFLKLELIDASFSFDGVSAAFAITSSIIAIAIGLGIGSLYIRSGTIFLTRENMIDKIVFLDNGAYWSIGFLSIALLGTMAHPLPEWITGGVGVAIITGALFSSLKYRRNNPEVVSASVHVA